LKGYSSTAIFNDPLCSATVATDLIYFQAVGYYLSSTDIFAIDSYAILKSSISDNWGDDGFIKVKLDDSSIGLCGLYANAYSYEVVL
jgi:hypothetical protein